MPWTATRGLTAPQAPKDVPQRCCTRTDDRHLSLVVRKGSIDQGRSPVQGGVTCASGGGGAESLTNNMANETSQTRAKCPQCLEHTLNKRHVLPKNEFEPTFRTEVLILVNFLSVKPHIPLAQDAAGAGARRSN